MLSFRLYFFLLIGMFSFNIGAQVQNVYVPYYKKGKWGYSDTSGTLKIQPFSTHRLGFFDTYGFALTIDSNNNLGLINSKFKTILHPQFKEINVKSKKFIAASASRENFQLYASSGALLMSDEFRFIEVPDIESNYFLTINDENELYLYKYDPNLKKPIFIRKHFNAWKADFIIDEQDQKPVCLSYKIKSVSDRSIRHVNILTGEETEYDEFHDNQGFGAHLAVPNFKDYSENLPGKTPLLPYQIIEKLSENTIIQSKKKSYINSYLLEVCVNNKWGVITTQNEVVIPLIYDTLIKSKSYSKYDTEEELREIGWIYKLKNKYGIVSTNPIYNIEARYEKLDFFSAAYIMAGLNNQYGVLNFSGQTVIPFEIDSFEYGYSKSLNWCTCPNELILFAIKNGKIALFGTKGGKTDYLFDSYSNIYFNSHFITSALLLKAGNYYGLAICYAGGFKYIPPDYLFISHENTSIRGYQYFLVKTVANHWVYIDDSGRKFFEE